MLAKIALAACAMVVAGAAEAVVLKWETTGGMSQAQEPVVLEANQNGSGFGRGRIDTDTGEFSWRVRFENLTAAPTGHHFHGPAGLGVVGPVTVDVGAISGLGSPAVGSTVIDATDVDDLLAGLWYLNVHTAANPAGEIRGQVYTAPVPLPAALPLALAGVVAFGALAARRRLRRG
jgi:hypothetical protein